MTTVDKELDANERRRAWTNAFWQKLRANPELYEQWRAKNRAGWLRLREGGYFGPAFKRTWCNDGMKYHHRWPKNGRESVRDNGR